MSVFVLVCYDIRDARRLRRVARWMGRFGTRVQKSVFECELDETSRVLLLSGAAKLLDPTRDSLRLYPLCRDCARGRRDCGCGAVEPLRRGQGWIV